MQHERTCDVIGVLAACRTHSAGGHGACAPRTLHGRHLCCVEAYPCLGNLCVDFLSARPPVRVTRLLSIIPAGIRGGRTRQLGCNPRLLSLGNSGARSARCALPPPLPAGQCTGARGQCVCVPCKTGTGLATCLLAAFCETGRTVKAAAGKIWPQRQTGDRLGCRAEAAMNRMSETAACEHRDADCISRLSRWTRGER